MPDWLDPVHAIDAILLIVLVEALAVAWRAPRAAVRGWLANLAAGALLLLAIRAALTSTSAAWLALWLAASGIAHAIDVSCRARKGATPPGAP